MKVKHKNSGEVIDLTEPSYGKYYLSIYGYLIYSNNKVFFIYNDEGNLLIEDMTYDFDVQDTNKKIVMSCDSWDNLVKNTYHKPYCFQQQNGCRHKGVFKLDIPSDFTEDDSMYGNIPYVINGSLRGIKFNTWFNKDPKDKPKNMQNDWEIELFWERNFYPDIYTLANDMFEKGIIASGEYTIEIDW